MDRLSFVFSLLLIVSVTTTFGSVIKAKNPTEEELEGLRSDPDLSPYPEMPRNPKKIEALQSDAGLNHYPEMVPNREELVSLLKRSHGPKSLRDQDSEMYKREGDVIPSHEFTEEKLQEFLNGLPSATRKVAIGIDNKSTITWEDPSTYFVSGTANGELPDYLPYETAVLYGALSIEDEQVETIGVLTYYIQNKDKTLAVMWSDPYKKYNTWNIRLYDGKRKADNDMFIDLRDHDPIETIDVFETRKLGYGLKAMGVLFSCESSLVRLEIHVQTE